MRKLIDLLQISLTLDVIGENCVHVDICRLCQYYSVYQTKRKKKIENKNQLKYHKNIYSTKITNPFFHV